MHQPTTKLRNWSLINCIMNNVKIIIFIN